MLDPLVDTTGWLAPTGRSRKFTSKKIARPCSMLFGYARAFRACWSLNLRRCLTNLRCGWARHRYEHLIWTVWNSFDFCLVDICCVDWDKLQTVDILGTIYKLDYLILLLFSVEFQSFRQKKKKFLINRPWEILCFPFCGLTRIFCATTIFWPYCNWTNWDAGWERAADWPLYTIETLFCSIFGLIGSCFAQ